MLVTFDAPFKIYEKGGVFILRKMPEEKTIMTSDNYDSLRVIKNALINGEVVL